MKSQIYSIAFLGTDGAGKSTIIKNLMPSILQTVDVDLYYEHLRPNYFPSIAKLLRQNEKVSKSDHNPHGSTTSGLLGSLLRWGYYIFDYTIGYYMKVERHKNYRPCIWIFDRYYYDYFIDPKRSRLNLPKWILKIGLSIIPEPDIIFCLGTLPKIIYARKSELSIEEIERQVKELQNFCSTHDKAIWIDTDKSVEEASQIAFEAIKKMMQKEFKGKIK